MQAPKFSLCWPTSPKEKKKLLKFNPNKLLQIAHLISLYSVNNWFLDILKYNIPVLDCVICNLNGLC